MMYVCVFIYTEDTHIHYVNKSFYFVCDYSFESTKINVCYMHYLDNSIGTPDIRYFNDIAFIWT